jgi:2-methylaconitate cis-trans-isomerase PrpF
MATRQAPTSRTKRAGDGLEPQRRIPAARSARSTTDRLKAHWPAAAVRGDQLVIPAVVMRGGTSRGVFFHGDDLPLDPHLRERVILAVFGSPDPRQIDGLGGSTPLTSKVAIVTRSAAKDADVDYLFGQVGTDEARIDYAGNCGNMLAAVGPFSNDEGLVALRPPVTSVRIHVGNSGQQVVARVQTAGTTAQTVGTTAIAGVPGTGASVLIETTGLGATLGRGLLPTGVCRETISARGRPYSISIVDAGNPTVFVHASEIGVELESLLADKLDGAVLDCLEAIRAAGAVGLGLVRRASRALADSPTIPKIYVVHPPARYLDRSGRTVAASDVSLVVRGLSMGVPHPAIATTVAVCVGAAARIPGTVVAEVLRSVAGGPIWIGNPSGVVAIQSKVDLAPEPQLVHAEIERTARRVMAGLVHVPVSVLGER